LTNSLVLVDVNFRSEY